MGTSDKMVRGAGESYERDFFADLIKSTDEQLKKFDQLDKTITTIADSIGAMLDKANPKTVRGINDIFTATEKLNEQTRRATKAEKGRADAQKLYTELTKKQQLAAEQALQRQRERGIKQMAKEKKAAEEAARPYRRLEAALAEARRKYQDLAAAGKAETQQGREQLRVVNDLRGRYEKLNTALGNNQFAVGRYKEELKGLATGYRSLIGLASQFGLALNGAALAQGALQTLRDFDEGAADMAKTLNISKEEARQFSQQLLKIDTRTGVNELQKIASIGGQLGIEANQIVAFTEATDKLNVALGDEFQGGAEEITQTLGGLRNIFSDIKSQSVDVDLLRIGNALNVLGADGAATSPVMADFAGRIGGVGIPLGLTTDQVLGLSSTLQELNVNAERGGTAVSSILKKMTTDTGTFAKLAGMNVKDFESLLNNDLYGAFMKVIEGSKKYGYNSVELSKILADLGIDGAGASEVFLKLGSNTELLDKRIKQAGDSLLETDSIIEEFNTKNNTLSANVEKLGKAWDEYILSADSATGVTGKLSSVLGYIATNLPKIISHVIKLVAAFGLYRVALVAVNIQQQIGEKGAKGFAKELFSLKRNTDGATDSTKGMGNALKGIAWTAVIALALEAAAAIWDIASGAAEVRAQAEAIENAKDKGGNAAGASNDRNRKETDERIRLIELEKRKRIAAGEDEQKVIRETQYAKLAAYQNAQTLNKKEIEIEQKRISKAEANAKRAQQLAKNVQANLNKQTYSGGKAAKAYTEQLSGLAKQMGVVVSWEDDHDEILKKIIDKSEVQKTQSKTKIDGLKEYNGELKTEIEELQTQNIELDAEGNKRPKSIVLTKEHTQTIKENTTALKDNNDALARRISLADEERRIMQEISGIQTERDTKPVRDAQDEQMRIQMESIDLTGEYQVDELERLIAVEYDMRVAAAEKQAKFDIEQLKNKIEDEYTLRLSALTDERDKLLQQDNLTETQREAIQADYAQKVADLNAEILEGKKLLALQEELIELNKTNAIEGINQQRADRINEINDQLIAKQTERADETNAKAQADAEKQDASYMKRFRLRLLRTKKSEEEISRIILEEEIKRLRRLIDLEEAAGHDTLDLETELEEKKRQLDDMTLESRKKNIEELAEFADNAAKEGFKLAKENSEAREALIDKEIESSQKLADALREQAQTGTAIASQSLAAQDQITNEKIRQKKREQKEQQQIEELRLLYEGTQQYLEKGDSLPVAGAKAFVQVKGLRAIFSTLKGFFKGTKGRLGDEDTPFAPGRDGHVIRADGSEGILSGDKMDRLEAAGIKTTDEITDNALAFKRLMSGAVVPRMAAKSMSGDAAMLNEIKDLKRVIKAKTEFAFTIVKNAKTGVAESMILEERTETTNIRTRHETRKK